MTYSTSQAHFEELFRRTKRTHSFTAGTREEFAEWSEAAFACGSRN